MTKMGMLTACAILALLSLLTAAAGEKEYYRLVAMDARMCPSPSCGGYFVQKVNVKDSQKYVFQILYPDSSIAATVTEFTAAYPAAAVIFFADLVDYTPPLGAADSDVDNLNVTTVYLGMPGQPDVSGLNFYSIATTTAATYAKLLNSRRQIPIQRSSVTPVSPTYNLDLPWQLNQILSKGALVAATIAPALRQTSTISIKAVYIKLPVLWGPCPLFKISCDTTKGGLLVFNRTVDLCFIPSCVYGPPMACTLSIPGCANGYKLARWPAPPGACNTYACDPLFTTSMLNF